MMNKVFPGMPADTILQQSLAAAMRLDAEAAELVRQHRLPDYDRVHAAAAVQWQVYRDRLAVINQKRSQKVFDTVPVAV